MQGSPLSFLDEKGHDTAFYIFNEIYHCTIPVMDMRSIEDLQMFGVPDSGYASWNQWMASERREIMLPIMKHDGQGELPCLLMYFKKGAAIRMRQDEAKKVYDRVQAHLTAWRGHLDRSLNIGKAPLEDLRDLDKLAHALYENAGAKYQFTDEIIENLQAKLRGRNKHVIRSLSLANAMENAPIIDGKFVKPNTDAEGNPTKEWASRESMAPGFLPKTGMNSRSLNQQRIVAPGMGGAPSLNQPDPNNDPSVTRKPSTLAELMTRGRKGIVNWDQPSNT